MTEQRRFHHQGSRTAGLVAVVCALLVVCFAAPSTAQSEDPSAAYGCHLQGSWLASVDIGGQFFTQYTGANAASGALTVEWIQMDPTLFGNFPTAVSLTQGLGGWQFYGHSYVYTWIAYGLDSAGIPVYAIKGSGTGMLQNCDTISFDWVLEVFPAPLDPLTDDPVTCLSGFGSKTRIPVATSTCP